MLKIEYPLSVVAIDDDEDILNLIKVYFKDLEDYELTTFTSANEALLHIEKNGCRIAIVDINMEEMAGPDVLKEVLEMGYGTEVIIITAEDNLMNFTACYRNKATSFLFKPLNKKDLLEEVDICHENIIRWKTVFTEMMGRKQEKK